MELIKQTPRAARLLRLLLAVLLVAATNEAAELAEQLVSTTRLLLGRVILLLPRGLVGKLVEEIHGVSRGCGKMLFVDIRLFTRTAQASTMTLGLDLPSYIRGSCGILYERGGETAVGSTRGPWTSAGMARGL